jgi:hypothetical protein
MGLQINPPVRLEGPEGTTNPGDDWGTRIAKLIPAEALGLYGSAVAMVPTGARARPAALWLIIAVSCVLLLLIRYRSARDPQTSKVQVAAIVISLVSFFVWLLALGKPTAPFGFEPELAFLGPLIAFLWGTMVPYFYRAEPNPTG